MKHRRVSHSMQEWVSKGTLMSSAAAYRTNPSTSMLNFLTFAVIPAHSLSQASLQLPPSSCCPVGLVYLELMHERTHLLGGRKGVPLMLLPSAVAAEEACSLLLGSSSATPAAPIRTAAPSPSSSSFLMDLGCWLEATFPSSPPSDSTLPAHPAHATRLLSMGLQLLCHSIRHSLPSCATAIMDVISTRLGITPEELLHSAPMLDWAPLGLPVGGGSGSIDPPSLSVLHMAMLRGDLHVIRSLQAWAGLHSVRPDWTVAGPSGICPLHLAALLPNAEVVVRGMLELPRPYGSDIAATWLLCRSSDGRTPAELGSTVGLPASLDSLARDALVRAAGDGPSYDMGVNLGSVAKSTSSASGASGIAAMMGSLLTGEDGVGATRLTGEEGGGASNMATKVADRGVWKMPVTASADKAEGLPAALAHNSKGNMGCHSSRAAPSTPASPGFESLSNSSPPSSLSSAAGRVAATRMHLCRLLLLGFPNRSVERRYAQFKVGMRDAVVSRGQ